MLHKKAQNRSFINEDAIFVITWYVRKILSIVQAYILLHHHRVFGLHSIYI